MVSRQSAALWFAIVLSAGAFLAFAIDFGWSPSIEFACGMFALILVAMWLGGPAAGDRYLTRYIAFVYAMPFVGSLEYALVGPQIVHQPNIWGLTANPYQRDLAVIARMTLVGALGALGLAAGMLLAFMSAKTRTLSTERLRVLPWTVFWLIALLSFALSWLNAPVDLITKVNYTESENLLEGTNFNAAYLLSYTLMAVLALDALAEARMRAGILKKVIVIALLAVVVGWFQFARGDRESVSIVAALGILVLDRYRLKTAWVRKVSGALLVAGALAGVFIASQVVGVIRSQATVQGVTTAIRQSTVDYLHGTWSAVLLTPLSVVYDADHDDLPLKWGSTYVDYALSIPPGPVAAAIGYKRPLEGDRGPAWEMHYALGGTHILVVPFMNFRSFGVLLILLVYGYLVGWTQMRQRSGGFKARLWYVSLAIVAPFWLWYGEMSLLREAMAFGLVLVLVAGLRWAMPILRRLSTLPPPAAKPA